MNRQYIYYIGSYDHHDVEQELLTQPSANTKIKYFLNVLHEAGIEVKFFSTAICRGKQILYKRCNKYDGLEINYLFSIGQEGVLNKLLSFILIYAQIILVLFFNKERVPVLIYHSPRLTFFIQKFKFLYRKTPLYFEIEEIYAVVRHLSQKRLDKEIVSLRDANGYIVVNDTIKDACGLKGKSVVCYGIYEKNIHKPHIISKDSIKIVYAGGLDSDAELALDAVKLLQHNFSLHILGYGNEKQVKTIKQKVLQANLEAGVDKFFYDGCLAGVEYDQFLDTCNIGVSTRIVTPNDSIYAFPSKILVYLSHNLITISMPHQAIQRSSISNMVNICDESTAKSVAEAIVKVTKNVEAVDNTKQLNDLHRNFVCNMRTFFT